MDQISFLHNEKNDNILTLLKRKKDSNNKGELLKVFHSELKSVEFENLEDIFGGYDEIRAITFSYEIKFIEKIMKMFNYGEIILGGQFMARKDGDLHESLARAITLSQTAVDYIRGRKGLVEMISSGNLYFKSPKDMIDHSKVYLLKADDGRSRVVISSANMTARAWGGDQMEKYVVYDTEEAYEEYFKDFNTAWDLASDIPQEVILSKKTDTEEDIPIIKSVLKTQKAIVLEKCESNEEIYEKVKYFIDVEKKLDKNIELTRDITLKENNGKILVTAESLKFYTKKLKQMKIKKSTEDGMYTHYPTLTFDYNLKIAFLNEEELDLNPIEDEVKNDIDVLFYVMDNYNRDFIGDTEKVRETHYKLLNILFSSPFNAKLRCVADIKNISTLSLPLYTLLSSVGSNTGKTFMTKFILKLMTNLKDLPSYTTKDIPSSKFNIVYLNCKGLPIFVDEINGSYYGFLKTYIKNSDQCERHQREEQPMIIFASNQLTDPGEPERKRMPFLRYNTNIKSKIDATAYKTMANAMFKKVTNALYREYLRRMLDEVYEMIQYMIELKDTSNGYYPDLIAVSSKVLKSIFKDFGYDLPSYVRELSWNDDFSYHAKYISEDIIKEIKFIWENNPKSIKLSKDNVIIYLGSDNKSKKKVECWANSLPPEFEAESSYNQNYSKIIVKRKRLEKYLGFKLNFINKIFRR